MHNGFDIIAILEGVTEFLPISSTAHLILAAQMMHMDLSDAYIKFYLLFIQLGALCAGVVLFSKRILTDKRMFYTVTVSFLPTAVFGFAFYKIFKHLLDGNIPLLATVLFAGGVVFIWLENVYLKRESVIAAQKTTISLKDAALIGCAQSLAIIPGVSRSGSTIVAGLLLGIKKATIVEYTFLLALPTLGAAVLYDAYKSREMLLNLTSYSELAGGFLLSALVSYVTLLVLKKYLPNISLAAFGWYRIVLAVLVFISLI